MVALREWGFGRATLTAPRVLEHGGERELILRSNQTLYLPGVFNVLILGCARNGQVERAVDTLRLCRLSGVVVSDEVRQRVRQLQLRGAHRLLAEVGVTMDPPGR